MATLWLVFCIIAIIATGLDLFACISMFAEDSTPGQRTVTILMAVAHVVLLAVTIGAVRLAFAGVFG